MITCSPAPNTLNVLLRDASLLKFVKFVSHDAPGSRADVALEYVTDLTPDELREAASEQASEEAAAADDGAGERRELATEPAGAAAPGSPEPDDHA